MPNFGTYQGHQVLTDAMNNSLNRVVDVWNKKQDQKNWEREFKEKQENDSILRQAKQAEFEKIQRTNNLNKKRDAVLRSVYGDINTSSPFSMGPDGNILVADNANEILKDWEGKSNYGTIMNLAAGLDGDEYGGVQLTMDDIATISSQTEDYAKHQLNNIQKMFVGMDADEVTAFFDRHEGLENAFRRYNIDIGNTLPEDEDIGDAIKDIGSVSSDVDDAFSIPSGYSSGEWSDVHADRDEWGGGIEFKGYTTAPSGDDVDDYNLIMAAAKASKDGESGDWAGDYSDTMWIQQSGPDSWTITENDGDVGMGFADDTYEIILKGKGKDRKVYINFDGTEKLLSSMESWDWE
tara:strand:- start:1986 stop:3035 length:1050 start_codon:yes stop_codon:yes gene_type:complete